MTTDDRTSLNAKRLDNQGTAETCQVLEETQRLEDVYQSKQEAVEELRRSVLQRAFEGEL